jgi:endonuclease/exonuclease/phosphatase family metal-dependent hydrolase
MSRAPQRTIALALLVCACGGSDDAEAPASNCPGIASTPMDAELIRLDGAHAGDDPAAVRLCDEGATLPADLENPWDLHCDIASGLGVNVDASAPPPNTLRVVEWNIQFGSELDGIIDVLENDPVASTFDVLLLVEVDRGCNRSGQIDVARTLAERWGLDWVFGVEFVEHSQGGCEEGNAILSRHALGNALHRFHDVGKLSRGSLKAPYDWSLDADEPRTGRRSFVGADVRFGGGLLHVVSAHLENRSEADGRGAQASEILDLVGAIPRKEACIAGDFNVYPDLGSAVIDAPLFDRFDAACFDNPHADMPQPERKTRPSINYQIDFTYVRGVRVVDRGVLNQLVNVPSDHYPVWVDVSVD